MAELLIKAKPHWMDSLTQAEVDKMMPEEKQSYEARSQIGDIIIVRSDGWQWGKEEQLPNFIVIKIPGLKIEDAKIYEETLMDTTIPDKAILLKHRKYQIPKAVIDNAKQLFQSIIIISKQQKSNFISNIIQKVS